MYCESHRHAANDLLCDMTGIGLLKRIRCDSMLPKYASRCWRRGEHDGVDDVCASENQQVCAVCTVSHIGMQLTIYCVT